jgi:hypothetical protein
MLLKLNGFLVTILKQKYQLFAKCPLERMKDFVRKIDEKFPIGHETEKQLTIAVIKATNADVIVLQEIESNKSSEQAPPSGKED